MKSVINAGQEIRKHLGKYRYIFLRPTFDSLWKLMGFEAQMNQMRMYSRLSIGVPLFYFCVNKIRCELSFLFVYVAAQCRRCRPSLWPPWPWSTCTGPAQPASWCSFSPSQFTTAIDPSSSPCSSEQVSTSTRNSIPVILN